MVDDYILTLISVLQGFSAELASLLTFFICVGFILVSCRCGQAGLCTYNVLAIVVANIQVLRLGVYETTPEPVALGTILFATTYLVSDILTEHYGPKAARQSLILSFLSQLVVVLWMILCLSHKGVGDQEQQLIEQSMKLLFIPSARVFLSSLISYVISQLLDIALFQWLKNLLQGKHLWLRQNVSTFISGFIDNILFSLLAWIVFAPTPLSIKTVFLSYILAGYLVRFIVNILGTPVIYLSYKIIQKK